MCLNTNVVLPIGLVLSMTDKLLLLPTATARLFCFGGLTSSLLFLADRVVEVVEDFGGNGNKSTSDRH